MDRFEELSNFVMIVEAGGISAAADRLDLSKSVVSRRLKALEEHLGKELIVRTTRTQRITNEGSAFFERSKQILADLAEAEAAFAEENDSLKGNLRISAPVHFGQEIITPALNRFISLHDQLTIDLDLVDRHVNLVEEGYDLAIRIGRLPDSSLIARRLSEIEISICASPEYLAQHGEPKTLDDLAYHRGLRHRSGFSITSWWWTDAAGINHDAAIQRRMASNDDRVLLAAACAGHGIICIPKFAALPDIQAGRLVPIMTEINWMNYDSYAVYPPTRHLSHRLRETVSFLLHYVRKAVNDLETDATTGDVC